jgi:hypothetical protein
MPSIILPEQPQTGCQCYDACEKVSFKEVVGSKTLEDGGFFGSLLKVSREHINDSKAKGELTETAAGEVYAQALISAMKESVMFALEHGKAQKEIAFIDSQKNNQIQKIKIEQDDIALKIKLTNAQIDEMQNKSLNLTKATDSKLSLNAAQESKLACECCNQSMIMSAQAALYKRQAEGFNDNANQKLYETQMQTWAMVFADAQLTDINPTITNQEVCDSYHRLKARLKGTWNNDGTYSPAAQGSCN